MNKLMNYVFYCHRLPERSFMIAGHPFPLCSRCSGIILGYIGGLIGIFFRFQVAVPILLALSVPLVVDGFGQYYGKWMSNNGRRFLTGIAFGFSILLLAKFLTIMGYAHGRIIGFALKSLITGGI